MTKTCSIIQFDFNRKVELLAMAILLRRNIAQCDDRAAQRQCGATTARRDNRPAVGWVWTSRNLILDEALIAGTHMDRVAHNLVCNELISLDVLKANQQLSTDFEDGT